MKNECFLPLSRTKATACQHGSSTAKWGRYIAARSCQLNQHPSPIRSPRSTQQGFTLVELVVTVALVAILATLAFPDYSEFVRQWRRDSATRALTTSLQLARSEAIKSTRKVMVCPSTDGASCVESTEWNTGWIVFVDDGATDQEFDAGERLLQVASSQSGIATLASSAGVTFLQFLPNGFMAAASTVGANTGPTTFTVTPSGATSATKNNQVAVSRVGRAAVTTVDP